MSELLEILINVLIIAIFGGFCFVVGKVFTECSRQDNNLEAAEYFESVDVVYTSPKDKKEISILLDKWRKKNGIWL